MQSKRLNNYKILVLAVCVFLLMPFAAGAQSNFSEEIVLNLPNGSALSFQPETISLQPVTVASPSFSFSNLRQKAVNMTEKRIHRFLYDEANNVLFGYDLLVENNARQIRILVQPMAADEAQNLREKFFPGLSNRRVRLLTLPPSSNPQVLANGDALTLDLLVSQQLGLKITDRLKFFINDKDLPKIPVRDFTLDNIELAVKNTELLMNGESLAESASPRRHSGSLLWFQIPEKGLFVFSLTPREGYNFQKVGTVNDKKIQFSLDGNDYEWTSSEKIAPLDGAWALWVLRVPDYESPALSLNSPKEKEKRSLFFPFIYMRDYIWRFVPFIEHTGAQTVSAFSFFGKSPNPNAPPVPNPLSATEFRRPHLRVGGTKQIESLLPKK